MDFEDISIIGISSNELDMLAGEPGFQDEIIYNRGGRAALHLGPIITPKIKTLEEFCEENNFGEDTEKIMKAINTNVKKPWVLDRRYKNIQIQLGTKDVIDFIRQMYLTGNSKSTEYTILNKVLRRKIPQTNKIIGRLKGSGIPLRAFSPSALYRLREAPVKKLIASAQKRYDVAPQEYKVA